MNNYRQNSILQKLQSLERKLENSFMVCKRKRAYDLDQLISNKALLFHKFDADRT